MTSGRVLNRVLRTAVVVGLTTAAVVVPGSARAAGPALPACAGAGPARTLVSDGGTLESAAFDATGRLLLSDWLGSRVTVLDAARSTPRPVAKVDLPGGLAPQPDGSVLVGSGSMPITAAPALDRIDPDGTVHRGWFRGTPTNGLALSPDGATLYATVSLGDTRIIAVDTRTKQARTVYRPPAALANGFFDGLTRDDAGRLYAPLYLAGQVLRIDPDGTACTLATSLTFPAGVTLGRAGRGFSATSLYVTTHAGKVVEIPHALPANL